MNYRIVKILAVFSLMAIGEYLIEDKKTLLGIVCICNGICIVWTS